jgi:hypothetical protein
MVEVFVVLASDPSPWAGPRVRSLNRFYENRIKYVLLQMSFDLSVGKDARIELIIPSRELEKKIRFFLNQFPDCRANVKLTPANPSVFNQYLALLPQPQK